ncbi:BTAD domain-containing putative transcriptional regulator [Actinoplanes sp. NPDC049265]|uniref:AfsR/SARP family transcriptional regulator n=1 Tax=Actinoplanes sp. NPDC049265 TaxID=3363902 RepID=UPI00372104A8
MRRVRLLGSIDVVVGDQVKRLPGQRRQAALAALALRSGSIVETDALISAVWGDDRPATAANTIQNHVSFLRSLLEDRDAIEFREPGYLLVVETDVREAERLLAEAATVTDPDRRVELLRATLGLWRGPALASLGRLPWFADAVQWLAGLRNRAEGLLVTARLDRGEHDQVLPELERLAQDRPFDERLQGQLIMALYRVGRPADALTAYQRLRAALGAELGVDPSPELRELEVAILRHDPVLRPDPELSQPSPAAPAQLPAAPADFTGRLAQIARLDAMPDAPGLPIMVIAGLPGSGKTATAVRWAHRVRDRFPDGQLFVDLQGYADGPAVRPIDALTGFLSALGVPSPQIPVHVNQAAALYRTLLSGRRMLIVLDNAGQADQVRPLLPGGAGCFVLVTSRDQLGGLVARDGARPLPLDTLDPAESHELLTRVLGLERVAAEPEPAERLAQACGHLPLALRIAAATLLLRPELPIAALVERLRADSLGTLTIDGDPRAGVEAAFDASYRALPDPDQRLFRLLSLVPGRHVSTPAARAMAGPEAVAALGRLAAAHLLVRTGDRFQRHDLIRTYAAQRAAREETAELLATVQNRLYDWYLGMVGAAAALLYPHMLRLPERMPETPFAFADHRAATDWLDAERADLVAAIRHGAADVRLRHAAVLLADGLRGHFHLGRHVAEWLVAAEAALDAAGDDGHARAAAHHSLGTAYRCAADLETASAHYAEGLRLSRAVGWSEAEATALGNLGIVGHGRGRLAQAVEHLTKALTVDRRTGRHAGVANNAGNLAAVVLDQGRLADAVAHYTEALDLNRRSGSRHGQSLCLTGLGRALREQGRPVEAEARLTEAIRHCAELGDRDGLAMAYVGMADVTHDLGRTVVSAGHAREALDLARQTADTRTEALALISLGPVSGSATAAAELYRGAYELAVGAGVPGTQIKSLLGLAEAALELGDHGAAHRHAVTARTRAASSGYRVLHGSACLLAARVHLAGGDTGAAERETRQALALHRACGYAAGERHATSVLSELAVR